MRTDKAQRITEARVKVVLRDRTEHRHQQNRAAVTEVVLHREAVATEAVDHPTLVVQEVQALFHPEDREVLQAAHQVVLQVEDADDKL